MIKTSVLRGLAVGVVAGLIAGGFAFAVGEPQVDAAIAIEERMAQAAGEQDHEHAPVSRDGQRVGLFFATALYGLAIGGIVGFAVAALRGRSSLRSDVALAAWIVGVLFVALVLAPFLKYPASPPGVGDPATITERTLLFYAMVGASLLSALAAWRAVLRVGRERPAWARLGAGAGVFGLGVVLAAVLLPGVSEVPEQFPGDVLRDFRLASLGVHAVLWSSLGTLLAVTLRRWPLPARTE